MPIEWRTCTEVKTWAVCNDGSVKNLKTGRILTPNDNGNGYLYVSKIDDGKMKHHYVHRLVANAFIPKEEGKPEVNHIDGNKANNTVSNLEWCSRRENIIHAIKTGLKLPSDRQREIARENGRKSISRMQAGWDAWSKTEEAQEHFAKCAEHFSGVDNRKSIVLVDSEDTVVLRFESLTEAAKFANTDVSTVSKVCRGKCKRVKGHRFRYENDVAYLGMAKKE